ncbi:MAG: hypothetical protein CMJ27_00930 [Phycisphaerae bacterium]|nr:hypothetical protein [Phycisphaerae bacterium]
MTDPLTDSLRWAIAIGAEPERSTADWLAIELAPGTGNAVAAICDPVPDSAEDLERLRLLKLGFKTLRLGGEDSTDRRLAARYYAATLAAGLVRHGVWISRQRTDRIVEALRSLAEDEAMNDRLRAVASTAIAIASERVVENDAGTDPKD